MKTCSGCGEEKSLTAFYCKQRKGYATGYSHQCRSCITRRAREQYQNTTDEWTAWMNELKSHPCMDCKHTFAPVCMDWDHRPGEVKKYNVSEMRTASRRLILAEIAKCDLVCANCHRVRTYERIVKEKSAESRSRKEPDD